MCEFFFIHHANSGIMTLQHSSRPGNIMVDLNESFPPHAQALKAQ